MKKVTLLVVIVSLCTYGMSYQAFKRQVLKHSKILRIEKLKAAQVDIENAKRLRPENPELQLELSRFNPTFGNSAFGASAMIAQPIRLNAFLQNIKAQNEAAKALSSALRLKKRADFLKNFEAYYTDYVYLHRLKRLLDDEIALARRTAGLAQARYQEGADDKIAPLRAKARLSELQATRATLIKEIAKRKATLLTLSGLKRLPHLPTDRFIYPLQLPKLKKAAHAPELALYDAKAKVADAKLKRAKMLFEKVTLYGGIEKEPDQSILRLGVSIPLPLLHKKEQERALAKLEHQRIALEQQQYRQSLAHNETALYKTLRTLIDAYRSTRRSIDQTRRVVTLLQEGYKISGEQLFELLSEEQKLIKLRKRLLDLAKEINKTQIALRYIKGYYND